jgi:hypothetical protein
MARGFSGWLGRHGYASYDPYDVWGTRYGLFARRTYYRSRLLGLPFVAPVLLTEILCPRLRAVLVRKQRYATADAQLLLAFLNLHALSPEEGFLERAVGLADDLLRISIPDYSGHCWGYPFDWQNNSGLWEKNTPYITATPYCFEAFLALHDVTGERRYRDVAASAAKFVSGDLRDTPTSDGAAAGSYSPNDASKVINASAYRAYVLAEAWHRFGSDAYRDKAAGNVNFILESQEADGSWLYALDSPNEAFIDHFHTCFVLKNLYKANRLLHREDVAAAIDSGYAYYREKLFDAEGSPKPFAVAPRTQLVRFEMYNFAEAITLGCLLRDDIPAAFDMARELAFRLHRRHRLRAGHFVTRVYLGGIRHTVPFLRWPQAQLFYAVTNLLEATGT